VARSMTRRLRWLMVLVAAPGALLLASCGFPVAGGMLAGIGIVGALLVGLLSVASLGSCTNNACLSVRACLSPPDSRMRDRGVLPDRGPVDRGPLDGRGPDRSLGPCLTPRPSPDTRVGPCLSPPLKDAGASLGPEESRDEVIARLEGQGALPAELAERLRRLRG